MERLTALVPRPRLPLIRFHGVLAPNAKRRPEIIPSAPVNANNTVDDHRNAPHHLAPARISWARLLRRVFDIDIEQCPQYGCTLKIIAAIEEPPGDHQDPHSSRLARPGTAPITGGPFDRFQMA